MKRMYSGKLEEGNPKAHAPGPVFERIFIIATACANLWLTVLSQTNGFSMLFAPGILLGLVKEDYIIG